MNHLRKSVSFAFKKRNLFYTNLFLSVGLGGLGDYIEQKYEIHKKEALKWDKLRTTKMASTGIPIGIFCHYYYIFLDTYLPGRQVKILVKKLCVDQFICSPLCISGFLICIGILDSVPLNQFVMDFKEKGYKLYVADWMIWPPAQVINFYILPTKYRVLYDNIISLGLDIYTSYVNYNTTSQIQSK